MFYNKGLFRICGKIATNAFWVQKASGGKMCVVKLMLIVMLGLNTSSVLGCEKFPSYSDMKEEEEITEGFFDYEKLRYDRGRLKRLNTLIGYAEKYPTEHLVTEFNAETVAWLMSQVGCDDDDECGRLSAGLVYDLTERLPQANLGALFGAENLARLIGKIGKQTPQGLYCAYAVLELARRLSENDLRSCFISGLVTQLQDQVTGKVAWWKHSHEVLSILRQRLAPGSLSDLSFDEVRMYPLSAQDAVAPESCATALVRRVCACLGK